MNCFDSVVRVLTLLLCVGWAVVQSWLCCLQGWGRGPRGKGFPSKCHSGARREERVGWACLIRIGGVYYRRDKFYTILVEPVPL